MRLACLFSALAFVLVGCGNNEDDAADDDVALVDSGPPDAIPDAAPPDAASCVGQSQPDVCGDLCVNFDTDELNCGSCGHPCNGGEYCGTGTCACPGAIVPESPTLAQSSVQDVQGLLDVGFGGYEDPNNATILDGLAVTATSATATAHSYNLSATLFSPPSMIAVYNGNLQAQQYDAIFLATAGTIVFDTKCADSMSGHASNVTFQGATGGIQNLEVDPDGCTFTVPSITFAFGPGCPTN